MQLHRPNYGSAPRMDRAGMSGGSYVPVVLARTARWAGENSLLRLRVMEHIGQTPLAETEATIAISPIGALQWQLGLNHTASTKPLRKGYGE
jgi:hypothetical protein